MSRLHGPYDAALHLLDRQIVDADGLLVAKVDDVALSPDLRVVGLLCGTPALLARLGGSLGPRLLDFYGRMGPEQGDRTTPYFLPITAVAQVGSDVRIDRVRLHVFERHQHPGHRLGELLGLPVHGGGQALGRVMDVRVTEHGDVDGLVVGRGGVGSMLGYDRRRDQGPWLLAWVIRWLHRHAGYVARTDVVEIRWGHSVEVAVDRLAELRDVDQ